MVDPGEPDGGCSPGRLGMERMDGLVSQGPGGGTCCDVFCGCFECLASSFKPFSVSSGGGDLLVLGLSASTRHTCEQICDPSLPCFSALVAMLQFGINIMLCASASHDPVQ